jgi:hypothetical protein
MFDAAPEVRQGSPMTRIAYALLSAWIGAVTLSMSDSVPTTARKGSPGQPEQDINAMSASCPPAAVLKAIDHDLRLIFDHDPTEGTRECSSADGSRDLTVMQSRVYRALSAMRQLQFTEPLPWTKDSVYRWLTKTVHGIRFRADAVYSSCCGPDQIINVRSVVETPPDGRQFGFALGITHGAAIDTDFRLLVSFLQLLVHEARHNDGKLHTCGTKDRTIQEMGAWGSAYTFQRWIADKTAPGLVPEPVRASLLRATEQICRFQICDGNCGVQ